MSSRNGTRYIGKRQIAPPPYGGYLTFSRFMRAMVRYALADQPALEIPHRKVQQPSDAVILDALRALWVLRKEDGTGIWFQWGQVPTYTRRILDALQIPVNRRFVWDPSE